MNYGVETDGIDHINVSCQGRTLLGMMLYNGSFSPTTIPDAGTFTSIHGYWSWLLTDRKYDIFKHLYGEEAFAMLKGLPITPNGHLEELVSHAIDLKLNQNLTLAYLFNQNKSLPYVSYGEVNHEPLGNFLESWVYDDSWTIGYFTYLQNKLT